MAFRHRPDNGSLFRNDFKEEDRQPDFTGDCVIIDDNGKEIERRVAGWNNPPKDGKKGYMSLRFSKKEDYQPSSPVGAEDFDDDIPF